MNYFNTFISTSDDSDAKEGIVPKSKAGKKTMPVLQYEMIANHPYKYMEEDIAFETHADYTGVPEAKRAGEREKYLAQDLPCLRVSALVKTYGWGIHFDDKGKVAIYGVDSKEYKNLVSDPKLTHYRGFRSHRV